jgi:hypothetical protein
MTRSAIIAVAIAFSRSDGSLGAEGLTAGVLADLYTIPAYRFSGLSGSIRGIMKHAQPTPERDRADA